MGDHDNLQCILFQPSFNVTFICFFLVHMQNCQHFPWRCHEMNTFLSFSDCTDLTANHMAKSLLSPNAPNVYEAWVMFASIFKSLISWWRHQMETFSALLAICAGNSPVPGEFTAQRPVTRSFDVFLDLRLNKRLSKQSGAGDLRRYCAHYYVIVMWYTSLADTSIMAVSKSQHVKCCAQFATFRKMKYTLLWIVSWMYPKEIHFFIT